MDTLPNPYRNNQLFPPFPIFLFGRMMVITRFHYTGPRLDLRPRLSGNPHTNMPRRMPNNPRMPSNLLANQSRNTTITPELRASILFLFELIRESHRPQFRMINYPIVLDTDSYSYEVEAPTRNFAKYADFSEDRHISFQKICMYLFLPKKIRAHKNCKKHFGAKPSVLWRF